MCNCKAYGVVKVKYEKLAYKLRIYYMDKVMGGTFLKNSIIYIVAFLAFWTILAERITITSTIFGFMIAMIIYAYVNESYKGINLLKSIKLILYGLHFYFSLSEKSSLPIFKWLLLFFQRTCRLHLK